MGGEQDTSDTYTGTVGDLRLTTIIQNRRERERKREREREREREKRERRKRNVNKKEEKESIRRE